MGYGKDGKIGRTQVLFSMMIDGGGSPVGYRVHRGDRYEGHTFQTALEELRDRYQIDKVVVVADRGMLSRANISRTVEMGYDYIVGERIRSLPADVRELLLDRSAYRQEWFYLDNEDEKVCVQYTTLTVGEKTIICTYSEKRAKKDRMDRLKRIEKAGMLLQRPSLLKNKPRRYYLKSRNDKYELDVEKIERDGMFDGFMAISTNTSIGADEVLQQYKRLYKIEHAFRTLKSHLEVRPMFHWTDNRIKGHICMCYIAFALQNWVLRKVNRKNMVITEKGLREMLDKMQLSLLKSGEKEMYVRSSPHQKQNAVLNALGIKELQPLIAKENLQL